MADQGGSTEDVNPRTRNIDRIAVRDLAQHMHVENAAVQPAMEGALPAIGDAITAITERLQSGGRLIYIGAGTSGRLGVLDSVECPPTFGTRPELVVGVIAGGVSALTRSIEGVEDDTAQGAADLKDLEVTAKDAVVGISASGRTPYTLAALRRARDVSACTVAITCNADTPLASAADIAIELRVGAEVIAGSTRLKAGTATKLAINMISTGTMIQLGRTTGNLMSHLMPVCDKLRARQERIRQSLEEK